MKRSDTLPISRPLAHHEGSITSLSRSPTAPKYYTPPKPSAAVPSSSQNATPPPSRPSAPAREHTDYITMLLALDTIPRLSNILASFTTWLLLAGFLIFPGTFTSLEKVHVDPSAPGSDVAESVLHSVKHIPLLVIASICTFLGAAGMVGLWWKHGGNYVWVLNRIFLPGTMNSAAGVIGTLIGVYAQNGGQWSITAKATVGVTGGAAVVNGVLFGVYNFWVLEGVKRRHAREMSGHEGEGWKEKMGRRAREPALEPGSVV